MIDNIIKNAREEEIQEVYAATGQSFEEALIDSINSSSEYFFLEQNGDILGATGVVPFDYIDGVACTWMLTTTYMKKYPIYLVRNTREVLDYWGQSWKYLFNYVDNRYIDSLRWANHVGFKVYDPEPYGYLGLDFCKIVKEY